MRGRDRPGPYSTISIVLMLRQRLGGMYGGYIIATPRNTTKIVITPPHPLESQLYVHGQFDGVKHFSMEHEQNFGGTKIVPSMVALGLGWDARRSVLNRVGVDASWGVPKLTPPTKL